MNDAPPSAGGAFLCRALGADAATGEGDHVLKRIKYISRFARPLAAADIQQLTDQAAHANAERGITGVLMTSGGIFFQIIEGPHREIDALWGRIVADDRHRDVLLLAAEEEAFERLFPDWSMRKVDLDEAADIRLEPLKALLEAVFHQRRLVARMTDTIERAAWSELSREG